VTIQRVPEGTSHQPVRLSSATTGAASELIASAELMRLGFCVYRCESPHAPFDLVAYRDGACLRVEVKTLAFSEFSPAFAPAFTAPTNNEWDVLALVGKDCDVFLFEFEMGIPAIRAALRLHFGFPLLAETVNPLKPCGTIAAYRRHVRRQEPICDPCLEAQRQYQASRSAPKSTLRDQGAEMHTRLGVDHSNGATGLSGWPIDDSCICPGTAVSTNQPNPECPVHHGRRARGPKPPPVGPGCICDGSGRTCPRHGAVI
jgi:hypothetical protein